MTVFVQVATSPSGAMKRVSSDESGTESRKALNTGWASPQASVSRLEPDAAKPLDRQHVDVVINLLLRLACQVFILLVDCWISGCWIFSNVRTKSVSVA